MKIVFCQDVNCEDFGPNILFAYHAAFEVWCGVLGGEEGDKSHGDGQVPLQIQRVVIVESWGNSREMGTFLLRNGLVSSECWKQN